MATHFAVVTTSRADYGLLKPLIDALNSDPAYWLSLLVTGSHLSPAHGETIQTIRQDNLPIAAEVLMNPANDSPVSVSQAIGAGLQQFADVYESLTPLDGVIVLGDRYELMAACVPAAIQRLPIIHLHGGEVTQGAVDDAFRHGVSKMAAVHFTSHPSYTQRLVAMGEQPERVHTVGAIGLDAIRTTLLLTVSQLSDRVGLDFSKPTGLLTYHPVTLDNPTAATTQIQQVLAAIEQFPNLQWVITKPNSDAGNQTIIQALQTFEDQYPNTVKLVANLGQQVYLSTLAHGQVMLGNSSSGILESAAFQLPTVNIGDRQGGRERPDNVIDVVCEAAAIQQAIEKALSEAFRTQLANLQNPYGDGHAVEKMLTVLNNTDWTNKEHLLKKGFYDSPETLTN